MSRRAAAVLIHAVRQAGADATLSDRDLLKRYAEAGDQAAFAAVVSRHTPMVLDVCNRLLHSQADAEDACQAVFLVLARKAGVNRWQLSVANWLYTTARRVARNARVSASRRARREGAAAVPESVTPVDRMSSRELLAALDEELDRLPPRYREPLVLCYLEGLTRDEAAARLGVPDGTLKKQLERGRKKLADALTARGCALGAALLTTATFPAPGISSTRLLDSILSAAGGSPSATVAALAQGVAVNGIISKALLITLTMTGLAVGFAALPSAAEPHKPAARRHAAKPDAAAAKPREEIAQRIITGKVVTTDGQPIQAELLLVWSGGRPRALGQTKPDGTFRVRVPLNESGAFLVARATGYGLDFLQPAVDTPAEVTLKLPKDQPIRGRVLDTQGKPVAGALVFPRRVDDYGTAGVDVFLSHWKTHDPQSGPLGGEYQLRVGPRTTFTLPDGRLALATKTDANGRFELRGLGADRVITLTARGAGVADTDVMIVNRANFDADAANQAAADNRARMLPKRLPNAVRDRLGRGRLSGPSVTLIAEPEKLIRGVVRDRDTGKPRPGVEVTFQRVSGMELLGSTLTAITDTNGRFEIRGSRKRSGYVVEVAADPKTGYLPSQVAATDIAGYAPIDVVIPCVKGVVLTGKMTNKETGQPLAGVVFVEPMRDNPYLKKYLGAEGERLSHIQHCVTRDDGSYRLVVIPGPVLVMAGLRTSQDEVMYQPARADPKYPQYFHTHWGALAYVAASGGQMPVRGCWCKVVNAGAADRTFTQNIELEPAKRKPVRVLDPDGKPIQTCDAAGVTPMKTYPIRQESGTVSVYGLEPRQERLIVVCEQTRKLIGSIVVRDTDKDPVLTLRPGGRVTGRAVDAGGQPLAGITVQLRHLSREASGVFDLLHFARSSVQTDANGTFRIDAIVPGYGFKLVFYQGRKRLDPAFDKLPTHTIDKHGATLELGELKLSREGRD
jgi:RNA polymerase sigma factor (sigma-70 family)